MSGRRLARLAAVCLTVSLLGGCAKPTPQIERNVLFILVDDLGTHLGSYGHPLVRSPNIDRLATAGVRFDRAYAQYPLCHPSRTSILSGRYPETTRVLDNDTDPRIALGDLAFLPEHFRNHGYHTRRFGKVVHTDFQDSIDWGPPSDEPSRSGVAPPSPPRRRQQRSARDTPASTDDRPGGRKRQQRNDRRAVGWRAVAEGDASQIDGRVARRAARWLEEHHRERFFLAVGFSKPHPPFVAPERYFDLYPADTIALPEEPADHLGGLPDAVLRYALADPDMPDPYHRRAIAAYYACVSFIDAQVGLLLETLDRLELWDDTAVVLVSDHGAHLGEHLGLWRKGTLFEGATQVPLIIAAPGARAGSVSPVPVELVDLFPTLTELTGLPAPDGLQGASLVPELRDPTARRERTAYTVLGEDPEMLGRSIRTERYRFTEWPRHDAALLYDLDADPNEYRNLWSATDPLDVQRKLEELLRARSRAASGG